MARDYHHRLLPIFAEGIGLAQAEAWKRFAGEPTPRPRHHDAPQRRAGAATAGGAPSPRGPRQASDLLWCPLVPAACETAAAGRGEGEIE